jgi:hypothetical protein
MTEILWEFGKCISPPKMVEWDRDGMIRKYYSTAFQWMVISICFDNLTFLWAISVYLHDRRHQSGSCSNHASIRGSLPQSCLTGGSTISQEVYCPNHAPQEDVLSHRRYTAPIMPHRRKYYLTGGILPQSCPTGGSTISQEVCCPNHVPQEEVLSHRRDTAPIMLHRRKYYLTGGILPQSCLNPASKCCPNHALILPLFGRGGQKPSLWMAVYHVPCTMTRKDSWHEGGLTV